MISPIQLMISPIQLLISLIQLMISTIHLVISANQVIVGPFSAKVFKNDIVVSLPYTSGLESVGDDLH